MEGIIFIGIQASGKSTFYKKNFFNSHLRISLDLLNTRNKEIQFLDKCIELHQKVVIDNTNPTKENRQRYIRKFKEVKYEIMGCYFQSQVELSLNRNANRKGKGKIPDVGILSTYKQLQLPTLAEGFDKLFYVAIEGENFVIKKWENEI